MRRETSQPAVTIRARQISTGRWVRGNPGLSGTLPRLFAAAVFGLLCEFAVAQSGSSAPRPATGAPPIEVIPMPEARAIADALGLPIERQTASGFIALQGFADGVPLYYTTHNAVAADSISTDECLPGGSSGLNLLGTGVMLGIWDGGSVLTTHRELTGRAQQMDSPGGVSSHSTHVAGTMIAFGVTASAKGMSPAATLACWDWNNDYNEMAAAAAAGLLVSNQSYGYVHGWNYDQNWYWYGSVQVSTSEDYRFGLYTDDTWALDQIAFDNPRYLACKSAGNDRDDNGPGPGGGHYYWEPWVGWTWSTTTRNPDGEWDCIGTKGVARNILTVAAVNDIVGGYANPAGVVISVFSSWGPTDDGRIKPDITANGVGLYSSVGSSNSAYDTYSGTSMSAPNVSGSLGLLIEHWRNTHPADADMLAATLKGIVLHTADEAGAADGPDYKFGWGLMNTQTAAEVISADAVDPLTVTERTLANGRTQYLYVTTDGTSNELRASISWTDPPGTPPGALVDPPNPMLVNDLDLRIVDLLGNQTYEPWVLNPAQPNAAATTGDNSRDNVEQVRVSNPSIGNYVVVVSHKGNLAGGSQAFALVVTGATVLSESCSGDLNCDGWVDFNDINPFILALSNWDTWKQRYPDCPEKNADVNKDGIYGGAQGFGDINPFIALLASSGGYPIPCP